MKTSTVYLSQNKWLFLNVLTEKSVFVRTENGYRLRAVSQAFVVDYGEAKAYYARSRYK